MLPGPECPPQTPNSITCLSSSKYPKCNATASPPGPSSGPKIGTPVTVIAIGPLSGAFVKAEAEFHSTIVSASIFCVRIREKS